MNFHQDQIDHLFCNQFSNCKRSNPFSLSSLADTSFLLANAQIVDYPIVHCSESFCKMSGFNRADVMQRSAKCSFMVGDKTDKPTMEKLERTLDNHMIDQFEILLYKKACE